MLHTNTCKLLDLYALNARFDVMAKTRGQAQPFTIIADDAGQRQQIDAAKAVNAKQAKAAGLEASYKSMLEKALPDCLAACWAYHAAADTSFMAGIWSLRKYNARPVQQDADAAKAKAKDKAQAAQTAAQAAEIAAKGAKAAADKADAAAQAVKKAQDAAAKADEKAIKAAAAQAKAKADAEKAKGQAGEKIILDTLAKASAAADKAQAKAKDAAQAAKAAQAKADAAQENKGKADAAAKAAADAAAQAEAAEQAAALAYTQTAKAAKAAAAQADADAANIEFASIPADVQAALLMAFKNLLFTAGFSKKQALAALFDADKPKAERPTQAESAAVVFATFAPYFIALGNTSDGRQDVQPLVITSGKNAGQLQNTKRAALEKRLFELYENTAARLDYSAAVQNVKDEKAQRKAQAEERKEKAAADAAAQALRLETLAIAS